MPTYCSEGQHQVVLAGLPPVCAVGFDARCATQQLARQDPTEDVVERPEGTDPAAEDPTEYESEADDDERQRQAAIDHMRAEERRHGDERIGQQEQLDGPRQPHRLIRGSGEGAAERGADQKPQEQEQKSSL
jgi:hypothetical protein